MAEPVCVTILHVDDRETNRYVIRRILERAGHRVVEAASGEDGLASVALAKPDLIILDVKLPGIDGFEVCQRLKSDPATAKIPVLHLSAYYKSAESRAFGLDEGADAYLVSPAEPIELVATVRALLRARNAELALEASVVQERAARAEAERLYEEASRVNRLKDEFLATLSHELRTPLNAILGHTEILLQDTVATTDGHESLQVVHRNAKAQLELIEDLLDVSRIISGKLTLEAEDVDVGAVVAAALTTIELGAATKKVAISADLGEGAVVRGDPSRLQQLFWNLLANALKFTPVGGHIRVSAVTRGGRVEIAVEDDGVGIEAEFLPHVFERFRQENASTTRSYGGLGLGLAICRHVVELHGGELRAESSGRGRGSRFVVTLPLAPAKLEAPAKAPCPSTENVPNALAGRRVMVVDDSLDTRGLIVKILRRAGASVDDFPSVRTAMAHLRSADAGQDAWPDLCVCDIGMPEEDGYALLRQVRALGPRGAELPVAALTAYASAEDARHMLSFGFSAHWSKPVPPSELVERVKRLAAARTVAVE